MDFMKVVDWVIQIGLVGGAVFFVWFIIKAMISDLRLEIKTTVRDLRLEMATFKGDISDKFTEDTILCGKLRGNCMADREKLKKEYLTEEMHKIVCSSTQNKFLLHVSEENSKLGEKLMNKIEDNKTEVINIIKDLRKDLKANGNLK